MFLLQRIWLIWIESTGNLKASITGGAPPSRFKSRFLGNMDSGILTSTYLEFDADHRFGASGSRRKLLKCCLDMQEKIRCSTFEVLLLRPLIAPFSLSVLISPPLPFFAHSCMFDLPISLFVLSSFNILLFFSSELICWSIGQETRQAEMEVWFGWGESGLPPKAASLSLRLRFE